jgi:hypothetical protein
LTAENEKLRRQNVRLQEELRKAGIIIEIQKNHRAQLIGAPAGPETPVQVLWCVGRNGRRLFGVL